MSPEDRFVQNEMMIYGVLNKYYPSFRFDEDLRQIAALGLWVACKTFDESKNFKFSTYAYRVILNQLRMYFRKVSKEPPILYLEDVKQTVDESLDVDDMLVMVDVSSDETKIVDALSDLTELESRILKAYMKDKSQRRISKSLGISLKVVISTLKHIRNKLGG